MNLFDSLRNYELFIYSIQHNFASVEQSTLVIAQIGATFADVRGELKFRHGYRLVVNELLLFPGETVRIDNYGYECWLWSEQLYWYDSQPHPHVPELASTDPHHKHVPPNVNHNRIPAPELSFTQPNLPFLISEVGQLLSPTP